jgi:hypothetical protein
MCGRRCSGQPDGSPCSWNAHEKNVLVRHAQWRSPLARSSDVKITMIYSHNLNRGIGGKQCECKGVSGPSVRNPKAWCTDRNQSSASYADQSNL